MVPRQSPQTAALVSHWNQEGRGHRRLLSLLRGHRMKRLLTRMLDETEFLSPYGVRALSRVHEHSPYVYRHDGMDLSVRYRPAESDSGLFGGNSNWRGPIWIPVNVLLIRALLQLYTFYGDDFKVECPTGSGRQMTLFEVSREIADRLERIFLADSQGRRPVYGGTRKFQEDPHWR